MGDYVHLFVSAWSSLRRSIIDPCGAQALWDVFEPRRGCVGSAWMLALAKDISNPHRAQSARVSASVIESSAESLRCVVARMPPRPPQSRYPGMGAS